MNYRPAKEKIYIAIFSIAFLVLNNPLYSNAVSDITYDKTYKISSTGEDQGWSVNIDNDGNIYLLGEFSSTADLDPTDGVEEHTSAGNVDVFLIKLDKYGNHLWTNVQGNHERDSGMHVLPDSNGDIYMSGYFYDTIDLDPGSGVSNHTSSGNKDAFMSKFDSDGNLLWDIAFGGGKEERGAQMALNPAEDTVYLIGTTLSYSGDFDGTSGVDLIGLTGTFDAYISKYTSDGDYVKTVIIGGADSDSPSGIFVDENNNVYVVGSFKATTDFDPGPGTDNRTSEGSYDIFVVKLNSDLEQIWAKTIGSTGTDAAYSLDKDNDGNIFISGEFNGTVDFDPGAGEDFHTSNGNSDVFLAKYTPDFSLIWAKTFGGIDRDTNFNTGIDVLDNVFIAGVFSDTVDFDPTSESYLQISEGSADIFLSKFESDGTFIWSKVMGGTNWDQPGDIAISDDGVLLLSALIQDTLDLDMTSGVDLYTSAGNYDATFSKYTIDVSSPGEEPVDTTPPGDIDSNDGDEADFELKSVDGNKVESYGGGKERVFTSKNKPSLKFERTEDAGTGVHYYEIRLTDTHKGLDTKKGGDYKWIGDIPHEGDSDNNKRERDGIEIKYEGDDIKIKVKDNKYKLDDGIYWLKIRAFDYSGNFTDTDEVKVIIGGDGDSAGNDETSSFDNVDFSLEKIGTIDYNEKYNLYYYSSNTLTLSGGIKDGAEAILEIDGEEVARAVGINGKYYIKVGIDSGKHSIKVNGVNFNLVVDPTRASFPEIYQ